MKRAWIWLVLVALVAGGLWFWRHGTSARTPEIHYGTSPIDRGRIVAKVTATGTLSALVTVQVGSQVSGRIAQLFADFNATVHKGQLIAKIDPQLFDAALEQAKANFLAAQADLTRAKVQADDAERQYNRSRGLFEKHLIATAEVETAESTAAAAKAAVEAARGKLEQAKANLHQAQVNRAYTDIVSPIDGIVISRNVDVGQTVAASLQAPTLFVLAEDLKKMQVDTSVAEADVGKLTPGMTATFTVDAYPNERFRGTVRQVRNAPQTVQNVVTYDAVVDVQNPDLKLRPGMTANISFIYAERDDVLRVPNAALRFRPPPSVLQNRAGESHGGGQRERGPTAGGSGRRFGSDGGAFAWPGRGGSEGGGFGAIDRRMVWVLRGGAPVAVSLKPGVSDGTMTEVVEGELSEGDPVITEASGPGAEPQGGPRGSMGGGFRRVF